MTEMDLEKLAAHIDGLSPPHPWLTVLGSTMDWNREAIIAIMNAAPELVRLARAYLADQEKP